MSIQHRSTRGHILAQDRANFVTGKLTPGVAVWNRRRAAVRVRIGGNDNVRTHVGGQLLGQIECSQFLRVGERNGGEVRIGRALLGNLDDVFEARAGENASHDWRSHAVHGGVDDLEITGVAIGDEGHGAIDVFVDDRFLNGAVALGQWNLIRGEGLSDERSNLAVRRRNQLDALAVFVRAAAAEVDLIAIVLSRIVLGGDHHAGVGVEVTHGEGQQGSG